jgi:transcriptional regulator with XRE-family HTH domain
MLTEEVADAESIVGADLLERYEVHLAELVADIGTEAVAERTGLSEGTVTAIEAGDGDAYTVEDAAAVLALSEDYPDAEGVMLELRDHLMLQMSSAVLDVDALASGLNNGLTAREIQQKIEGRQDMTVAEYAEIHRFIAAENPY